MNYLAKVKGQLLCEGRGRYIKGSDIQVLGLEKGQLRAIAKSWIRVRNVWRTMRILNLFAFLETNTARGTRSSV